MHELFGAAADIAVADGELRISLRALSSPHRTLAAQNLCAALSETATLFPGTRLTMRFAIQPREQTGPAFPGPRPSRPKRPAGAPPSGP